MQPSIHNNRIKIVCFLLKNQQIHNDSCDGRKHHKVVNNISINKITQMIKYVKRMEMGKIAFTNRQSKKKNELRIDRMNEWLNENGGVQSVGRCIEKQIVEKWMFWYDTCQASHSHAYFSNHFFSLFRFEQKAFQTI